VSVRSHGHARRTYGATHLYYRGIQVSV